MNNDQFSDKSTTDAAVTSERDRAETDQSIQAITEDRNTCYTSELCDFHIQVSSRDGEICDTVGSIDPTDKLLDKRKCTCNEDSAFLSRPAGDAKKSGSVTIVEDECRICQSRGEEVLISPCKCAGSAKWVHESCLVKWFQVSQTSSCELCSRFVAIKKRTKPLQQVSAWLLFWFETVIFILNKDTWLPCLDFVFARLLKLHRFDIIYLL